MKRIKQLVIATSLSLPILALPLFASAESWVLDQQHSYLSFVTSKKDSISEVQKFSGLRATIDESHLAQLVIDAETISTGIDIRDQRLRDLVLETEFLPVIYLSTQLPTELLQNMTAGEIRLHTLLATLSMHGVEKSIETKVLIAKTSTDSVLVNSLRPVIIDSADFAMDGAVQALRLLAKVSSITRKVPVSFALKFNSTADNQGIIVQRQKPLPPIAVKASTGSKSVALQWSNSFDSDGDGLIDALDQFPEDISRLGVPGVAREFWRDNDLSLDQFKQSSRLPRPDVQETVQEIAGIKNYGDNYVTRLRTYLIPSETAGYTFYISGDNDSELLLSRSVHADQAQRIAGFNGYTAFQQYDKYSSQRSAAIRLEAGKAYYLEAWHSERDGGDHINVAWSKDGGDLQAIPVENLQAYSNASEKPINSTAAQAIDHFLIQYRTITGQWHTAATVAPDQNHYTLKPEFGGSLEFRVIAANSQRFSALPDSIFLAVDDIIAESVPTQALELNWTFDEPSYFELRDQSGNLRNSAVTRSTFVDDGISGYALTPYSREINTEFDDRPMDAFSVSFWVRPSKTYNYNLMVGAGWDSFLFHSNENRGITTGVDTGNHRFSIDQQLSIDKWQHIAFTRNSDGLARVYRNGRLLEEKTDVRQPDPWSVFKLERFDGDIDELRVYSRTLSGGEITLLHQQPDMDRANFDSALNGQENSGALSGEQLWSKNGCANCHGEKADGVPVGLSILDALNREDVVQTIANTMPYGNPGSCDSECAEILVAWLNGRPTDSNNSNNGSNGGNNGQPGSGNESNNGGDGSDTNSGSGDNDSYTPLLPAEELKGSALHKHLYKTTMNLVGRVPTNAEVKLVTKDGEAGMTVLLDTLMKEPAFYQRVKEIYNDRLHTDRYLKFSDRFNNYAKYHGGGAESMMWFRDVGASGDTRSYIELQSERAVAQEPLELISYVVRTNKPFTEILTADYTLLNYFSARAMGVDGNTSFRQLSKPSFVDWPQDPSHFKPIKLDVPHAGVLTTAAFLEKHPSTNTNRNRHRAYKVYEYFLDTDILAIGGQRPSTDDIAGDNPTMTNPVCVACHEVMDPVASSFKHWSNDKPWRRPSVSFSQWPTNNILPPGFNGLEAPYGHSTPLQWVAQRIATDPRFARATVKTLFTAITGHALREIPGVGSSDLDTLIYQLQQEDIAALADSFIDSGYNFKRLVKHLVNSDYFRGAAYMGGTARMLTPEMLERKITSATGRGWDYRHRHYWLDKLANKYATLYGGINDDGVLQRNTDPNGITASVQARMAAEVACQSAPLDLYLPASKRSLFPYIEAGMMPVDASGKKIGGNVEPIRRNIRHLHWVLYGERVNDSDATVDRAYNLLVRIYKRGSALRQSNQVGNALASDCRVSQDPVSGESVGKIDHFYYDREFQTRSWMGLLTYMLNDYRFLYE